MLTLMPNNYKQAISTMHNDEKATSFSSTCLHSLPKPPVNDEDTFPINFN